ncbi:hypothetical protein EV44_g4052 [Erysiphe necator]|uniref:Uncharacterized protein n=1 Tax=Uncinula necator TaxID=52586 RepID=A0A0B1P8A3_UNCNE|nr:hypothetical protein EV44_g4052 [Erysiphe necator]
MKWLDAKYFSLISEVDVPTHNRGNVLDLCFATHSLLAKGVSSYVQHDLDTTSDHIPLLITIPLETRRSHVEPKLRFSTINEKKFQFLLLLNISRMEPLQNKSPSNIDKRAEELVNILQSSFAGSAKKSLAEVLENLGGI